VGQKNRGIVAVGEVLGGPADRPLEPRSLPFWPGEPEFEVKRRIRLRYVVPPNAPLWLAEDTEGALGGLSVANGQGNKLYKVTPNQWARVISALGGWPETDVPARAATASAEDSHARRGQGFSQSPERKRAVELRAMCVATAYFEARGYTVTDTSANKPYDLVATKGDTRLFVEVKGTTTGGEQVILTKNEVAHAQGHPGECVLFVVHDIEVAGDSEPVASGGVEKMIEPWVPADEDLVALSFQYRVPLGV
jgi:hypothetical protein